MQNGDLQPVGKLRSCGAKQLDEAVPLCGGDDELGSSAGSAAAVLVKALRTRKARMGDRSSVPPSGGMMPRKMFRRDDGRRRVGEPGEHEPDDEHRVVEVEEVVDAVGHHHGGHRVPEHRRKAVIPRQRRRRPPRRHHPPPALLVSLINENARRQLASSETQRESRSIDLKKITCPHHVYLGEGGEVGVGVEQRLQERVGGRRGRELFEAAGERCEVGGGESTRPVDAGEWEVAHGEKEGRRRGVGLRRFGVVGGHWCSVEV
ncbi:hypothetical protein EJB05_07844, partial [Eragrostis curvula]